MADSSDGEVVARSGVGRLRSVRALDVAASGDGGVMVAGGDWRWRVATCKCTNSPAVSGGGGSSFGSHGLFTAVGEKRQKGS